MYQLVLTCFQRRRVTVHIAEMGFSSDFAHRRKYENKQLHYQPLMEELRRAGWNVHGKVHVITVGVRATVPNRNDEVLKEMGVSDRKDREGLQRDLVWTSAKHAATIIAQFREVLKTIFYSPRPSNLRRAIQITGRPPKTRRQWQRTRGSA